MENGFDTRLGAYVLVVADRPEGRCLLLALWNEPEQKRWMLPGGGVELEESVEEGAVREAREETGYDVELGDLLWVSTRVVPAAQRFAEGERALQAVRVVLAAEVVGGELRDEVGGSTDTARWIPVDQVRDLPHASLVAEALDHLDH